MKSKTLPSIVTLAAVLAGNASALTPIIEKFNGSKLDGTRWYQYRENKGKFIVDDETLVKNPKLNFVVSGKSTKHDYASVELLTSQPGYNESWEVILDLSNTVKDKKAGCGIMLANVQDRNDYLYVEFFGEGGVSGGVVLNGDHSDARRFSTPVGLAQGSIRISFNHLTKVMTFEGSATKPYDWHKIGTFSPAGNDIEGGKKAKKRHVKADWQMNPAGGRFVVQLFGFGESVRVARGKATLDNLSVLSL